MSAVSPQIDSVCKGVWLRVVCHGLGRMVNNLTMPLRDRVERTFAWEDKFKRLLLRFEYIQKRHYGMKLMAYTLINLRRFCSA